MTLPFTPPASDRARALGQAPPRHIAMLGNFPPRQCGIATFTQDSWLALKLAAPDARIDLYAMDDGQVSGYPAEVTALLPEQDVTAYRRLAERINSGGARLLWIQHEFGIFGGPAGDYLLELLDALEIPFAVTLHTLLEQPDDDQRRVMRTLLRRAAAVIVMAAKGREILTACYGCSAEKIFVIPHGIPDQPLFASDEAKLELGFGGRKLILTFGLLSPDKGIADMIAAMPEIRRRCPDAHYLVLGATHPHLLAREGQAYRLSLMAQARNLGVGDAVSFHDSFVSLEILTRYLAAADVYVTPYRNAAQITSGTLSYAFGMGKAVVSTPYVHASELLSDDHGVLVDFRDSAGLARAVGDLLTDDDARAMLSARSYKLGRSMIWPRYGEAMLAVLARATSAVRGRFPGVRRAALDRPPALAALERMTDDTGILQHSLFGVADRRHGYCIDDNARALLLTTCAVDMPAEQRDRLAHIYAAFLQHAWNEDRRCFRNFMSFDRRWLEDRGSDDSNGRAIWALGVAAARYPGDPLRHWANVLFDQSLVAMESILSLRARAFALLGCAAVLKVKPGHDPARRLATAVADELVRRLEHGRRPGWCWFEDKLSYDNARLPEALIVAGQLLDRADMRQAGADALAWLARKQSAPSGVFRPVGTEGFEARHFEPALFDQQPLEAWAIISACATAHASDGDSRWRDAAYAAYRWYLGDNDNGLPLASIETGECHDGLNPEGVNLNCGAESILAWQIAHRTLKAMLDRREYDEPQPLPGQRVSAQ